MSWKFLQLGIAGSSRSPEVVKKVYKKVANINRKIGRFNKQIRIIPIIEEGETSISIGVMDKGKIVLPEAMAGTPKLQSAENENDNVPGEDYHDFPPVQRQQEIGYQSGDLQISIEEGSETAESIDGDSDFYKLGVKESPNAEQKCK